MKSLSEKSTILIVDDTVENIQILASLLRKKGYSISIAQNGVQALENLQRSLPDLVLLDIMMPEMDGYETCKKMKENPTTADIPIIFLTAKVESEDITRAFELGAVDYVKKPFNHAELLARIKTHLRLKKKSDLLEQLSSLDGLTDIPNRRALDATLENEWHRAERNTASLSFVFVDIDHFKKFNDTYGHAAGDDCLREVARTLQSSLNRPADFVARYGGEEFVVILPDTTQEGALIVAEQLRSSVEALQIPHIHNQNREVLTISLGVATTIPRLQDSVAQLIEIADKCLYESKVKGRNRVTGHCFHSDES